MKLFKFFLSMAILSIFFSLTGCASILNIGSEPNDCPMDENGRYNCSSPGKILDDQLFRTKGHLPQGIPNNPMSIFNETTPIRVQPDVYKLCIFPWEDEDKDLTWTTYVFMEIKRGRWNFGVKRDERMMTQTIPFQVDPNDQESTDKAEKKVKNTKTDVFKKTRQ